MEKLNNNAQPFSQMWHAINFYNYNPVRFAEIWNSSVEKYGVKKSDRLTAIAVKFSTGVKISPETIRNLRGKAGLKANY